MTGAEQQKALLTAYTDSRFCRMGLVAGGPKELPAYKAILDTCRLAGPHAAEILRAGATFATSYHPT